jgi:hypothetical protein
VTDDQTDHLEFPDHLHDRGGDNVPELILINPLHGYVKGNVMVVCRRAAQFIEFLRTMGTSPDELRRFADLIDGEELPHCGGLQRLFF